MSMCRRCARPICRCRRRRKARPKWRNASRRRARQSARFNRLPDDVRIRTNAEADGILLDQIATPDADGKRLMVDAADRLHLSARGYHRVLRVARTLADLDSSEGVRRIHVAEALSYRRVVLGEALSR
jgi:magnesium chelatase family protein